MIKLPNKKVERYVALVSMLREHMSANEKEIMELMDLIEYKDTQTAKKFTTIGLRNMYREIDSYLNEMFEPMRIDRLSSFLRGFDLSETEICDKIILFKEFCTWEYFNFMVEVASEEIALNKYRELMPKRHSARYGDSLSTSSVEFYIKFLNNFKKIWADMWESIVKSDEYLFYMSDSESRGDIPDLSVYEN